MPRSRRQPAAPYRTNAAPRPGPTAPVPLSDSERDRLLGYLKRRISDEQEHAAVLLLAGVLALVAYLGRSNTLLAVVAAALMAACVLIAILSPGTRVKRLRMFETFRAHPEQVTEIELSPIHTRRAFFRYTRTWLLTIKGPEGVTVFADVGADGQWLWPLLVRYCPAAFQINHQDVT